MKNKKLTFIDLFSGCGGFTEGFLQSNKFEALAHVEWEIPMVRTLRNRVEKKWNHTQENADKRVIHFDIQKTDELIDGKWSDETIHNYGATNHESVINSGLKGLVGSKKVNLIIGGPPCQAYSVAGRAQDKNSMKDDYRNYLFESFTKVVVAFQPDIFVFENVPGMLSACPGEIKVTERIYNYFDAHGYEIKQPNDLKDVVQIASDFGVPQNRKRVIIVGVRKKIINHNLNIDKIYAAIDNKKTTKKHTIRHAIGHLPKFKPTKKDIQINGRKFSHIPVSKTDFIPENHKPRFHNQRDIGIFKKWIDEDMNKIPMNERIEFYNSTVGKNTKHGKYRSLEWEKPSPTIVAHLYKDGLLFIHPDAKQARTITVKEAALLQSFPDDYEFIENMGYNYKMIGNAVPPLMAKNIALAIYDVISLNSKKSKYLEEEQTIKKAQLV
jgi:DNA (cytosine-5)-methyltransferase 1